MADATVRVSGTVLNLETRSGVSTKSGEPYSITTARVLVEETGVADVRLPNDMAARIGRGDSIDVLADASVYVNRVQLSALRAVA